VRDLIPRRALVCDRFLNNCSDAGLEGGEWVGGGPDLTQSAACQWMVQQCWVWSKGGEGRSMVTLRQPTLCHSKAVLVDDLMHKGLQHKPRGSKYMSRHRK
jgi:hypothetical protein